MWRCCATFRRAAPGDRVRRTAHDVVSSAGTLRLTHPAARDAEHFDARAELTQEQAAFALAADPRGHGNPDEGRRHLAGSTAPFTAVLGADDAHAEPRLTLGAVSG